MDARFFIHRDGMMMRTQIHLRLNYDANQFGVVQAGPIHLIRLDSRGVISSEDAAKLGPMLDFSTEDAEPALQSLMDELWKEGFRPKDIGTAGHLAATQKHLEDMRALVFGMVEPPKPE